MDTVVLSQPTNPDSEPPADLEDGQTTIAIRPAAPEAAATEQSPAARYIAELQATQSIQTLLAAVVVWAITVAPAGFGRGATVSARLVAVAALLAGAGGPLLVPFRRLLARHVGVSAFVALCTLGWLLSSFALEPTRLDPVRGITGAIAWGVFALSWSDRWTLPRHVPSDPNAPVLQARSTLPRFAVAVATTGMVAALLCLTVAWRVRDPDRAIAAHAVALAASVALITSSAGVAIARGKRRPGARRVTSTAARALVLLVTFAVLGAIAMVALR